MISKLWKQGTGRGGAKDIGGREEEVGVWGGGGMVKDTASMFNRERDGFLLQYTCVTHDVSRRSRGEGVLLQKLLNPIKAGGSESMYSLEKGLRE